MNFDLFDYLFRVQSYPRIIILNYLSIEYLIRHYLTFPIENDELSIHCEIPYYTQLNFKSKVNTLIKTIPSEIQRNKYGYYSNNIYDRILKFDRFMRNFIPYDLFDYVDIDQIIIQELHLDLRNEDESDNDEFDEDFSNIDELTQLRKKKNINKSLIDPNFKYAQIYNLKSIKSIISSIIEIFLLDGYSETDYKLKSFSLNSLTKTDYMVLFNHSFVVECSINTDIDFS